jgi:hypothetical protein
MSSPNNTTVLAGSGKAIVDNNGTVWTIKGGRVVRNGVPDTFTANVTELAFKNGVLWQENTAGLWYARVGNAPGNYHGWASGTYTAPVAEARTWIGGGNNNANRVADWSPHGVPQPGDTLTMANGTMMNLTGNQLAGDGLTVGNGSTATINISGVTSLKLDDGVSLGPAANTTVNLAANSKWIGGFNVAPLSHITVNGAGTLYNNTSSTITGTATIAPSVAGSGTITVAESHGSNGKLEFLHGVGAGQTLDITRGYGLGTGGKVTVDDVKDFHATTNLSLGDLLLKGVTASSYAFEGNTLILNTTKGALDLTVNNTPLVGLPAGTAIGVSQLAGGVLDVFKGGGYSGGTLVPLHA